MASSIFFIFRLLVAWGVIVVFGLILLAIDSNHRGPPGEYGFVALFTGVYVLINAFSHVRRVRLIAGTIDTTTLANRHRRQIEIPLEASEAFDIVDATIRELPGSQQIESARDSLQVRARVRRVDPYGTQLPTRFNPSKWFGEKRNQILAIVVPGDGVGSVTIICEPERGAWSDWFLVDDGTNLENAEAITRAITRRVADRRRQEKASVQQTVTEKELTVAKLSLLHAQVEPHFLYNTLANAQYLTRTDPARADEMLGNLITYLRYSLPRTENGMSTLGEEVERARAYLDILKIRMGARLMAKIEVPDEMKPLPLPTMMLQTLVENAIKHGLEPKSGGGTIWIIVRPADDGFAVIVADDGRGFSMEGGGTGIGLKNVRERLRLIYGARAAFTILANFPCGVAATITVPNKITEDRHHG